MNKEIDSRISTREEQVTQDTKDPHAILGLGENATISDIKKAYRILSLQYH
ncbi:MAG: Chaperone protein DnaJ [Wolbachia endosymbiont of Ctenocephalides orientis wCori]|nr:MAG: Chaperone protein DnaJ [Wolbachia endosymbiont of Ctenocephalides orientis wCori]